MEQNQANLPPLLGDNKEEPKKDAKQTDGNNEQSLVSFSSRSSSDSDDLNKMDDQMPRRGKKGSHRRRRSDNREASGSEEKNPPGDDGAPRVKRETSANDGGQRRGGIDMSRSPTSQTDGKRGANRSRSRSNSPHGDRDRVDRDNERRGHHRGGSQDSQASGSSGGSQDRRRRSSRAAIPGGRTGAYRNNRKIEGSTNRQGFFIPAMSKSLVSFQQFSSMQTRQADIKTLSWTYNQYKKEHKDEHPKAFWKEHEKEPWFMERYSPLTVYQIRLEQKQLAQKKAQQFFKSMPLSGLDLTKHDDVEMGDKEDGPQIYKFDANSRTLYLKQVPVFVSRSQLKDAVNSVCGGLEQVIFSEPLKSKDFERFAWLEFVTEDLCNAAITSLETLVIRAPEAYNADDFKLCPVKNNQTLRAPKVTPDLPVDHVQRDYDLCKKLIQDVYNKEKDIEFPFGNLESNVESLSTRLDTLLVYLRQVHGYCFYSGVKCDDERALAAKCSPQYLRQPPSVERELFDTSPLYGSAKQFETNYVQAAGKIIQDGPGEELVDPLEDEFLKSMKEEYCFNKTKEVQEGRKYSCKLCQKAFKSPDFVVKHIKNKHDDRLNEKFNYVYFRGQARDNYLDDPNRISSPPPATDTKPQNSFGAAGQFQRKDSMTPRTPGQPFAPRYGRQPSENEANPEGDKLGDGLQEKKPIKEYIDYDDPTQFGKGGQRLQQQQIQQQQVQQQAVRELQQLQAKPSSSSVDRQLVSYDDLF